ncbi:MAG TPA: tyrosine-type recombinase/integrase, partial [Polyangiaceae bacterium]|nr:tyrosine-type recombinase/integrase [Polyangiaceae bacterium]
MATDSDLVLPHLRVGALAAQLGSFASYLAEQGFTEGPLRYAVRMASELGRWLTRRGRGAQGLTERDVDCFLRSRWKRRRRHRSDRSSLRHLLASLRRRGIVPLPEAPVVTNDVEGVLAAFATYLRRERALAEPTVANYASLVGEFLRSAVERHRLDVRTLRLGDVHRFLLSYTQRGSRGRAKLMVTALRSFFRFLRLRGDIEVDLAAAVPPVASWRQTTLPTAISIEDVRLLLRTCDRRTAKGRRDYAILLLLARLGLRSREIIGMKLEDIDWDRGEVVVRGKLGRVDRLPLPPDVGQAVALYLRCARPACATRAVFLRVRAPRRPIGSAALSTIVARAVQLAGLHPLKSGAYLLRHSLATNLLRRGASLAEIGELLRHHVPTTTQIYAKHDLDGLRMVAQPWPGGRR